jgi:hypothetical protein
MISVLFDGDLGEEGFRTVLARSDAYRSHLVAPPSVGVVVGPVADFRYD